MKVLGISTVETKRQYFTNKASQLLKSNFDDYSMMSLHSDDKGQVKVQFKEKTKWGKMMEFIGHLTGI